MGKKILIEVCCGSVDDAVAAEEGGADRIELNSAIFLGGLTPSAGQISEARRRLSIPIISMVRPRSAGFCYTEAELDVMKRDVEYALDNGVDGIVFGILTPEGGIDMERSAELMAPATEEGVEIVFHRAFDVVPDLKTALEELIELGVDRVLTSGGMPEVTSAEDTIRELVTQADGRIQILPGGPDKTSVAQFAERTGCTQVHIAPFAARTDTSTRGNPAIYYGGALYPPEDRYDAVDRARLERFRKALNG